MKIYTIHSPSHQEYFDLFKSSLEICKDYELIIKHTPQISETGYYSSSDFALAVKAKVEYILEILEQETEPFVFSDVDIYVFDDFINDLKERLGSYDFIVQYEKTLFGFLKTVCSGLIYMKPNKEVRKMYEWILKNMERLGDDQNAMNRYKLFHKVNYGILPKKYYSINYDNGNKMWNGESVKISVNPVLFHYHWTIGYENKMKLLEMVKKQVCVN